VIVELSWAEFLRAKRVGLRRFESSEGRGLNAASSYRRGWVERVHDDIIGACGELAFCRAIGVEWDESVDRFHYAADVGVCEVRATRYADGCLIYREHEPADRWYYLVTGDPPRMTVRGCVLGRTAMVLGRKVRPRDGRPAWFVAQDDLVPLRPRPTHSPPSV